jgi:hypothetical protein
MKSQGELQPYQTLNVSFGHRKGGLELTFSTPRYVV